MTERDKEITILKAAVRAQAKMILHYRLGKTTMPGWVFVNLDIAREFYGEDLHKIK